MGKKPVLPVALLVGICGAASPALAQQQPTLVVDLAPGTYIDQKYHVEQPWSSRPNAFREVGGRLVFNATTPDALGQHWPGLWTTDGTAQGTRLLRTYRNVSESAGYPGYPISYRYYLPKPLTQVGNVAVFPAGADPEHGVELWRTDGTPDGTVLLRDIHPGSGDSFPEVLGVLDGREALFSVYTEERWELWRTDGTSEGTRKVSALPGPAVRPAVAGNTLFFVAAETELWKSDGTEAGTARLRTFPQPLYELTAMGSQVFFSGKDEGSSYELWRSDGTVTARVKDISAGDTDGPFDLIAVGNRLFFNANHPDTGTELWSTDGTEEGTRLAKDVRPGVESSNPFFHTALDERRLVFFADEAETGSRGLWVSDGTEAGTRLLRRVSPGFESRPLRVGQRLCFAGYEPTGPTTLWCTDGTEEGTAAVRPDVNEVQGLGVVNGSLLFWGGGQLWATAGTSDSTRVLTQGENLLPGSSYSLKGDLLLFDTGTIQQTGWELHSLKLDEPLPLPSDEPEGCGGCASSGSKPGNAAMPLSALALLLLWARRQRAARV